jgi:very-short-patch-repair endonuclease
MIFAQIPLQSLVKASGENRAKTTGFRNRIDRKRVDFVLVNPVTFATQTVIELDDQSHTHTDRQQRDAFVESVLDRAGIPIVRVRVTATYSPQSLRQVLGFRLLQQSA